MFHLIRAMSCLPYNEYRQTRTQQALSQIVSQVAAMCTRTEATPHTSTHSPTHSVCDTSPKKDGSVAYRSHDCPENHSPRGAFCFHGNVVFPRHLLFVLVVVAR